MATVQLATNAKLWMIGRGSDETTTNNTAEPGVQVADPVSIDGCCECSDMNLVKIAFLGSMSDNSNANDKTLPGITVYGWSPIQGGLWLPSLITRVEATLGNRTGVDATVIDDSEHFADTITLVDGDESVRICSGISQQIASITMDLEGATRFQVVHTGALSGTGVAQNFNFVYSLI